MKHTLITYECDRCHFQQVEEAAAALPQSDKWLTVNLTTPSPGRNGTHVSNIQLLCPACAKFLEEYLIFVIKHPSADQDIREVFATPPGGVPGA